MKTQAVGLTQTCKEDKRFYEKDSQFHQLTWNLQRNLPDMKKKGSMDDDGAQRKSNWQTKRWTTTTVLETTMKKTKKKSPTVKTIKTNNKTEKDQDVTGKNEETKNEGRPGSQRQRW